MGHRNRRAVGRLSVLVFAVMALGLLSAPGAFAAIQDIHSNGPLTDIWTGDNLTCQVAHTNDQSYEFFSPSNTSGSCGTFVSVDSADAAVGASPTLYGPFFGSGYTLVSQSGVTGSGTSSDPYKLTTVEDLGSTGLRLTQVDSYVAGNEYYQTDITVQNQNLAGTQTGRLYHAADCYLQGSDSGYGFVNQGDVACSQNANNSPPALIEQFSPQTPGSHYLESHYSSVWSAVQGQADLADTCACGTPQDNGMGINWDFSVGAGQAQTFSMLSNFSPNGTSSPTHTITATGGNSFSGTSPYTVDGTLATFSDSKSGTTPSEYSATIDWGDGTTSAGTISSTDGGFAVTGNHTYTPIGSYTITVTISDSDGQTNQPSVTDSVNVTPSHTISASGNRSFSGNAPYTLNDTVATFTDSKSGTAPSEYTATIDWGDDSSSQGSIQADNGGGFSVTGNHTYQSRGSYTITVTISDVNQDAESQSVTDSVTVGARHTISATGGRSFSGNAPYSLDDTVASFTDSKPGTSASDYTATIDWGDKSSQSEGGIKPNGNGFIVTGTHTYNDAASYTITVTITAIDGQANSPSVTDTATVNASNGPSANPGPTTSPPTATTSPTATSQSTQAQLTGSVNPGGLDTTVHWRYGLDQAYRGPGFSGDIYDQSTPDQPAGSGTSDESVSAFVSNLQPNAVYHYRLVATNSKGTTVGQDRTFKTASDGLPSTPVVGQSGNFAPAGGNVFVLINGQFVKLTEVRQLPNGTVVDALHGSLTLTVAAAQNIAAAGRHKTYTGTFGGAVFKVSQARKGSNRGLTTLSLVEGAYKGGPSYASCSAKKKAPRALSRRILQTLRSRASGRFRTRGRYAAGTVRGTRWTTTDRCDGTLISVQLHSVLVNDFVRHISVLVRAGHSYFAAAHPPRVVKPPRPTPPGPPFTG